MDTIIVIDGTIGVGKTTLLRDIKDTCIIDSGKCYFYDDDDFDEASNIKLEDFYNNPSLNYYRFQRQLINRLKFNFTHPEEGTKTGNVHFHDNHLISCFAYCRAGRNMGYISNSQYLKLKSKIRTLLANYPNQIPDYVIRIISNTSTSIDAIRQRGRRGELNISRHYLQFIANSQFYWLEKLQRAYGIKTITILKDGSDTNDDVFNKVWEELRYLKNKQGAATFNLEEGI